VPEAKYSQVIRTARRSFAPLVILAAVTGCDNVSWGGIDVSLRSPPAREAAPSEATAPAEPALPELPQGPVLFRVDRTGVRSSLAPVGEIQGNTLLPLSSETDQPGFRDYFQEQRMGPGREFVLFAGGVRVGRFIAGDSTWVDAEACAQPGAVSGLVEVIPGAATATRFLALDAEHADSVARATYVTTAVEQGWRATAANVAGTVIMDAGARWPPSMAGARGDVQVVNFGPDEPPLIAGSYLYQDRMEVAEAPPASYSFFYLAENGGTGYRYSYYWFRVTDDDGKGAARYFGHLDWNGDGRAEVLLEVLGARARWHAALSRTDSGFERTFEDPCGAPDQQAAPGA